MEEKKDVFPSWIDSSGYTIFFENYIHTSIEFTKHVALLGESRSIFLQLKGLMCQVEEELILDVLGSGQDSTFRYKLKNGSADSNEKSAIKIIQRIIAYKSMAKALVLLSLKLDERGVLVFDATGASDNKQYRKSAEENAIAKRADYYLTESIAQEKLLIKLLDGNINAFPDYLATQEVSPSYTSPDISDADSLISFM